MAEMRQVRAVMSVKIIERQAQRWIGKMSPHRAQRMLRDLTAIVAMPEAQRVIETASYRETDPAFPRQKPEQEVAVRLLQTAVGGKS